MEAPLRLQRPLRLTDLTAQGMVGPNGNAAAQERISDRIRSLGQRKSRLLDTHLDGKIDQETFEDKKAEIEAQVCLAKCEHHDEHLDALDTKAILLSRRDCPTGCRYALAAAALGQQEAAGSTSVPERRGIRQEQRTSNPRKQTNDNSLREAGGGIELVAPHAVSSWNQLVGRLLLFVNFYPTVRAAIG